MTNDIDSSATPTGPAPIATFESVTRRYGRGHGGRWLVAADRVGRDQVACLAPTGPARPPQSSCCSASPSPTPAWSACSAAHRPTPWPPAGSGPCCRTPGCPRGPRWPISSAWSTASTLIRFSGRRAAPGRPGAGGRPAGAAAVGQQRQRVRLALALAGNPELLILDEPTAALDVDARRTFWDRVRVYVAGGRTVLFATHRLEEADAVADRVVVIAGGRLLADGTPTRSRPKQPAAARSAWPPTACPGARTPARSRDHPPGPRANDPVHQQSRRHHPRPAPAGPHVQGLEVTQAGMEEAFRHLTHQGGTP